MNRSTPASGDPPTVLLLGERGTALDAATLLLAREGYRVLRCNGAEEAPKTLARERVHVVVLSEAVLDSSGVDLLRRLRAADATLPIILQSSACDARRRCRLLDDLGLDGVQSEDDDPQRLLELVTCVLSQARRLERTVAEHALRSLALTKLCHGLRTSMHVIHGYTQILRTETPGAPIDDILTRLNSASEGALELLRRHLGHTPAEPPCAPVPAGSRQELVNIDELVRTVCSRAAEPGEVRSIRVRPVIPWPAAFIRTDGDKLRTILADMLAATMNTARSGEIQLAVEFNAGQTHFILRHRKPLTHEDELSETVIPVAPSYPVTEAAGRVLGVEVAARLSSSLGASLVAARSEHGGSVFTLRVPTTAVMQPDYRSPMVH